MRGKFLKFIFAVTILTGINNNLVYANENIYEVQNLEVIEDQSKSNIEKKFEFKEDEEGLKSLIKLQKKTNNNFEVVLSCGGGIYKFVDGMDTFDEAKERIETFEIQENGIPAIIDANGKIIYATKAMGRVVKFKDGKPLIVNGNETGVVANIYSADNFKNAYTYVNTGYIDDVPIVESKGNKSKVLISGYKGWMDSNSQNGDLAIIPINQVKNPSYYTVKNGTLYHYISSDILTVNKGYNMPLGKAPSFLTANKKYYSYDGNYFYESLDNLIFDLENNSTSNAVNKSKYYDYFLNLPLRSKSIFNANDIDKFLNSKINSTSKLKHTGKNFIEAQDKFGVNALIMMGIAANESGWGTSNIANNNNNLFGLGAYDVDPGNTAHKFSSIKECIDNFAKGWMSLGYLNPTDWRFKGAVLGNKAYGINVSYASDPYWGEKASSKAYDADRYLGGKDIDNYLLGIYSNKSNIVTSDGKVLYSVNSIGVANSAKLDTPVIIANKSNNNIQGENCYKINPERPIGINQNFNGIYEWDKKAYIPQSDIKLINTKSGNIDMSKNGWVKINSEYYFYEESFKITGFKNINSEWYYFNPDGKMQTGWQKINDKWYYLNSSGKMQKGWQKINNKWYLFAQSGEMYKHGWHQIHGNWFYINEGGDMATGWKLLKDKWYYLDSNGYMKTGWQKINNKWYFLAKSGEMYKHGWHEIYGNWFYINKGGDMATGWKLLKDKWYYLDSNGYMKTGWQKINNKWYFLAKSGEMYRHGWHQIYGNWFYINENGDMATGWKLLKNKWYYLDSNGYMKTGWQIINNKKYYFENSGAMYSNGWYKIDGKLYYFNQNGECK